MASILFRNVTSLHETNVYLSLILMIDWSLKKIFLVMRDLCWFIVIIGRIRKVAVWVRFIVCIFAVGKRGM